MRLSHGFVRGETLACIYHGWRYDTDGVCRVIPAHPDLIPPATICAQTYRCQATDGLIWVALDETETAPPDLGDRRPLRSLEVARSGAEVARYFGTDLASVIPIGGPHDLALALQPRTEDSCLIHALVPKGQDRKAVSRHLEDLRAELEAVAQ